MVAKLGDLLVDGFNKFSNITCTINEKASGQTVPIVRCSVYLKLDENRMKCVEIIHNNYRQ